MDIIFIAFLAGILTALAPCVLPLIPVILGGSLTTSDKKRPFVIVSSLFFSIIIFTLLLKASTLLIMIPGGFWRWLSGTIIVLFGISLALPRLWEVLSNRLGLFSGSQKLLGKSLQKQGSGGAIITGAALGPVFTSCSPVYLFILATTLPQNFILGFSGIVSYALGLCLILLLAAKFGQTFISKFTWASNPNGAFKKVLGILLLLAGLAIITGWDRQLQLYVIEKGILDITQIERKLLPD